MIDFRSKRMGRFKALLRISTVIVASLWGCGKNSAPISSVEKTLEDERLDRVLAALFEIEKSSGQARIDARFRFYDFRSGLSVTSEDAALLPRLEALLDSKDLGDIELGVRLVCNVHHSKSLPKLWKIASDTQSSARGLAIECIAAEYKDPKLIPVLRDIIAHDENLRLVAVRALGAYTSDPAIVQYLHELLTDPKCVLYAKEALRRSSLPFDTEEAVPAQMSYSHLGLGLSIDYPENWPSENKDGYVMFFRNSELDATFGVRIPTPSDGLSAKRLIAQMEKKEHLKNQLGAKMDDGMRKSAELIGARDVASGRYTVLRGKRDIVLRAIVLVESGRAIIVDGESPVESANAFEEVFEKIWRTLSIEKPDQAFIEQLVDAIEAASKNAATDNPTVPF